MKDNYGQSIQRSLGSILRVALAVLVCLTLGALSGTGFQASAQNRSASKTVKIKGSVIDEDSKPVPGVAVLVKGHPEFGGTMTDEKGGFVFNVPSDATVQFSCIGYKPVEMSVARNLDWMITMVEESVALEGTVVVGYGVQRKESVVGAITQVKAEDLEKTGTSDITSALAGKVSGLLVYSQNGAPGQSDATLILRGLSSWNGSAPLVMVDGIERSMNMLSPTDIASVSVLKDASATAVYGAKGANGVILVTTKTGSKGAPKFSINVEQGLNSPMWTPEHVGAGTVTRMANIAYKNTQSFGSQFSDEVIKKYEDQSDPIRYPDVHWYDLLQKQFATSTNADFSVSGGSDRVRYYLGVSYVHEGSIIKEIYPGTNFASDRINYRMNLDWDVTKSTLLSFKVGGVTNMVKNLASHSGSSWLFSTIYQSPTITFPAYYPADVLKQYPDPNYPDADSDRVGANQGSKYENPYSALSDPDYVKNVNYRLFTDLILTQKLDFITVGLSATAKFGMTSAYARVSQEASTNFAKWNINWEAYDAGNTDIWEIQDNKSNYVWNDKPFSITQNNSPSGVSFITYLEGSLNYSRKFSRKHNVSALALYNQRQYNSGASFPKRTQSFVGRVTYDYKGKYLFESNIGVTGSEQFSPDYRYGVFPSAAVGYIVSKEKFWKRAMPWWSTMKIRYSNGWVGSDASGSNWLYYSSWKQTSGYYQEEAAANVTARWETAHKQDLGFEMGFLKNKLTVNVDLYDEKRNDMLMPPVVTAFVGVAYKDVNAGALKKHGFEVEANWRNTTSGGFTYSFGGMIGLSENRITKYGDAPYAPEYQKYAGTPLQSARTGDQLIDDKFFGSIDEIHGYPNYATEWTNVVPGVYKFLDYVPDGKISQQDLHVLRGSTYAPGVYSFNVGGTYKGLTFKVLCTGTMGKYINYKRVNIVPFYAGAYVIHDSHLNYWTPTNRDSDIPALSFSDEMYAWGGGTSTYPGYNLAIPDFTWKRSDYMTVKEVMVQYRFSGPNIKRILGVKHLAVGLVCNNLWTFSNIKDTDPQRLTTAANSYPTMRMLKLNVNLAF
ncbi:MAG: TonB-dependent receptor [Alistipes sp.]|nr:TonB-dependent receptor [Alistipes sp.]MCI6440191.1 TonB-dependent receptor [Alistipes sp.]MDY3835007.1 TonB-dependent receptor [Candidatus Cryptobacteroides sp.]